MACNPLKQQRPPPNNPEPAYNATTMTATPTFAEKLQRSWEHSRSLVCVGLDPDPHLMPVTDVGAFGQAIVRRHRRLGMCLQAPTWPFYEALGMGRPYAASKTTLEHIRRVAPSSHPIGRCQARRHRLHRPSPCHRHVRLLGFSTPSLPAPTWGADSVEPFMERPEKGVFLLCRTSNPGSADFQGTDGAAQHGDRTPVPSRSRKSLRMESQPQHRPRRRRRHPTPRTGRNPRIAPPHAHPDFPASVPKAATWRTAVREGVDQQGPRRNHQLFPRRDLRPLTARRGLLPSRQTRRYRTPGDAINTILEQEGKGWSLELHLGDELLLKTHPPPAAATAGPVERLGADIGIRCTKCGRKRHGGKDPLGAPGASGRAPA